MMPDSQTNCSFESDLVNELLNQGDKTSLNDSFINLTGSGSPAWSVPHTNTWHNSHMDCFCDTSTILLRNCFSSLNALVYI